MNTRQYCCITERRTESMSQRQVKRRSRFYSASICKRFLLFLYIINRVFKVHEVIPRVGEKSDTLLVFEFPLSLRALYL